MHEYVLRGRRMEIYVLTTGIDWTYLQSELTLSIRG